MASIVEQTWWPEILAALVEESVQSLAERFGVEPSAIDEGLRQVSHGGAAEDEPWWPEVRRMHGVQPIRALARRFGTNPRRIRRSLARNGWRAGGEVVGNEGIPALRPLLDRLGKEPDHILAALAGLTPEAVQGARKRFGIKPFRPNRAVRASLPEEDEGSGEVPRSPRRRREPVGEPEIIRRKPGEALGRPQEPEPRAPVEGVGEEQANAAPAASTADPSDPPEPPPSQGEPRRRLVGSSAPATAASRIRPGEYLNATERRRWGAEPPVSRVRTEPQVVRISRPQAGIPQRGAIPAETTERPSPAGVPDDASNEPGVGRNRRRLVRVVPQRAVENEPPPPAPAAPARVRLPRVAATPVREVRFNRPVPPPAPAPKPAPREPLPPPGEPISVHVELPPEVDEVLPSARAEEPIGRPGPMPRVPAPAEGGREEHGVGPAQAPRYRASVAWRINLAGGGFVLVVAGDLVEAIRRAAGLVGRDRLAGATICQHGLAFVG